MRINLKNILRALALVAAFACFGCIDISSNTPPKLNVEVPDSTYLPADAALKNLEEAGDNLVGVSVGVVVGVGVSVDVAAASKLGS